MQRRSLTVQGKGWAPLTNGPPRLRAHLGQRIGPPPWCWRRLSSLLSACSRHAGMRRHASCSRRAWALHPLDRGPRAEPPPCENARTPCAQRSVRPHARCETVRAARRHRAGLTGRSAVAEGWRGVAPQQLSSCASRAVQASLQLRRLRFAVCVLVQRPKKAQQQKTQDLRAAAQRTPAGSLTAAASSCSCSCWSAATMAMMGSSRSPAHGPPVARRQLRDVLAGHTQAQHAGALHTHRPWSC